MINKYRVHEVAKDFDCPSKEILDIVTKHFEGQKKSMTALEEAELDVIFEIVTQENSVESFDAYFATANEPKKEEKKEKKAEKSENDIAGSIYRLQGIEYVNIVMPNDEISN